MKVPSKIKKDFLLALAGIITFFTANGVSALDATYIINPVNNIICNVYCGLRYGAGLIALAVFAFAATLFLIGADDPGKRKQAKTIMIHVIVGLVILIIAVNLFGTGTPIVGLPAPCTSFC